MISTAISSNWVSRIVGYLLRSGNFNPSTPYLPQRIAFLGEANTANQVGLDTEPFEFISADEVGQKYGYGSPLHIMARIARPISGNPLGGIPTVIYPQAEAGGATAGITKLGVAVATTVTANATHKIYINGRDNIDGNFYRFNVTVGQTESQVRQTIIDTINNVLSAPCTAALNVDDIDITTKWKGATAKLSINVDNGDVGAGIVYSIVSNTDGTGDPSISDALSKFGETWNTKVINPYGETQFVTLEQFNGKPDPVAPTGRYSADQFKPFVALYGSLLSDKDAVALVTNDSARKGEVTNVACPAPNSKGFDFEAAVNMLMTYGPTAQNKPHLGNGGNQYPDMPIPLDENIGDFSEPEGRNFIVQKGSSTVNISNGKFTVQDFVTTYAPDGVLIPKFRYVRDLIVDWNYEFNWRIVMVRDIQDNAIVPDNSPSEVTDTISPSQGKQLLITHIEAMARLALIADVEFSTASIVVGINGTNPARLDLFNRYKRTAVANIVSTDVEVDFNFQA